MASEFLLVARKVFEKEIRPLDPREIVEYGYGYGLFSDKIAGKTPYQTMKSKISVDIRRKGDRSIFVRTQPGKFYLRSLLQSPQEIYSAHPHEKARSDGDVLVFPATALYRIKSFQGLSHTWKRMHRGLLRPQICRYMNRVEAEGVDDYKQVISYILITSGTNILSYRRGNFNRVEDFLKGAYCVGFGGHITQSDRNFFSEDMGLTDGAIRELNEELKLPELDRRRLRSGEGLSCVGVINDDSSEVGRRHFAFVFRYEVSPDVSWSNPIRGEKSITRLQWLSPDSLPVPIWDFEYWSQLCLREFFPNVISTSPAYRLLRRTPLIPPNILCILGEVGCGKSEATRIFAERFDYRVVNSGRVLAVLLDIPPIPSTQREEFQARAQKFIGDERGPALLASKLWDEIESAGGDRILIDGVRHESTLSRLRELAGRRQIGTLYVYTIPDVAFHLFEQRERHGISFSEFLRLRGAPVENDVRKLLGKSDAVLYNWAGLPEYRRTIADLAREITGGRSEK